jgi:hypothetical protein
MDPIVTSIVTILGKYTLDKGVELGKEVGPKALETVKEMFTMVLNCLHRDPKGEVIGGEFEQDPETYQKPLEKALAEAIQADAEFAMQLNALLVQYEEAAREHAAAMGTSYQAALYGSGAIAQGERARAVGERGVMVEGDVKGGVIVTGDGNIVGRGEEANDR